jgi:hypothetical protein
MTLPLIVCKTGILLVGASWGRVSSLDYRQDPSPKLDAFTINDPILSNRWLQDRYVGPEGHFRPCEEFPDLAPLPGTWEAYLAGTLSLNEFCLLNPGVGVGYDWKINQERWVTERMFCFERCGEPPCVSDRVWDLDVPGYMIVAPQFEFWGHENGQTVRFDVEPGANFNWVIQQGNPGPIAQGTVINFCNVDMDLSGQLNVLDFIVFLNQFAAGYGDWNMDGTANVLDFTEFLNSWSVNPCIP